VQFQLEISATIIHIFPAHRICKEKGGSAAQWSAGPDMTAVGDNATKSRSCGVPFFISVVFLGCVPVAKSATSSPDLHQHSTAPVTMVSKSR